MGRREQKKLATRRAIRHAALDLALAQGVDTLTVEAIAEAAQVSPRTFFNYFSCKEDALITNTAQIAEALRPLIEARPREEAPLHTLRMVFTEHDPLALTGANRERSLARQKLVQENPALLSRQLTQHALMEVGLAEQLAERFGVERDRDLRPDLLAGIAGTAVRIAVRHWCAGAPEPLVELIDSAFEHLESGALSTPPAGAPHA